MEKMGTERRETTDCLAKHRERGRSETEKGPRHHAVSTRWRNLFFAPFRIRFVF